MLEMENSYWFEQANSGGYPAIGVHARLWLIEEAHWSSMWSPHPSFRGLLYLILQKFVKVK
jgi:hypothetical protein